MLSVNVYVCVCVLKSSVTSCCVFSQLNNTQPLMGMNSKHQKGFCLTFDQAKALDIGLAQSLGYHSDAHTLGV